MIIDKLRDFLLEQGSDLKDIEELLEILDFSEEELLDKIIEDDRNRL